MARVPWTRSISVYLQQKGMYLRGVSRTMESRNWPLFRPYFNTQFVKMFEAQHNFDLTVEAK